MQRHGEETLTKSEQCNVEQTMFECVQEADSRASHKIDQPHSTLLRLAHSQYVLRALAGGVNGGASTYASQPWIIYWTLQSADLLGITATLHQTCPPDRIATFLNGCLRDQHVSHDGDIAVLSGFAGGSVGQIAHVATSYAACCALAMLGDMRYLEQLPRAAIKRWLLHLRRDDGSFCVHVGGEADIRASYCAAVIVSLLQLDDPATFRSTAHVKETDEDVRDVKVLTRQTALFVAGCQNHEGGFGCSVNGSEAHGAYTFCGLASLLLMREPQLVHAAAVRRWLSARQLRFEGGFNGRTNKLVDSCYSFWVGAAHALLVTAEAYRKLLGSSSCAEDHISSGASSSCYSDAEDDVDHDDNDKEHSCVKSIDARGKGGDAGWMHEEAPCSCAGTQEEDGTEASHDVFFQATHGRARSTTHATACASDGSPRSQSRTVLRAQEVFILDYAQLLCVDGILVTDTAAWDLEEQRHAELDDRVQQFLDQHDTCYESAVAELSRRATLRQQLMDLHRCCSKNAVPYSEDEKMQRAKTKNELDDPLEEISSTCASMNVDNDSDTDIEDHKTSAADARERDDNTCSATNSKARTHDSEVSDSTTAILAHVPQDASSCATFSVCDRSTSAIGDFLFDQSKVQQYVLRHCQNTDFDGACGGLFDKPGCSVDGYHTCYSLSGMSVAQNLMYLVHAPAVTTSRQQGAHEHRRNGMSSTNIEADATYVQRAFARGYVPCPPRACRAAPDTATCNPCTDTSKTDSQQNARRRGAGVLVQDKLRIDCAPEDLFGVVYNSDVKDAVTDYISTLRSCNPIINIHPSHVRRARAAWSRTNIFSNAART